MLIPLSLVEKVSQQSGTEDPVLSQKWKAPKHLFSHGNQLWNVLWHRSIWRAAMLGADYQTFSYSMQNFSKIKVTVTVRHSDREIMSALNP